MQLSELSKFSALYKSARRYSADVVGRKFLGLDATCPFPLSISHGVDYGHTHSAMDVHKVEPLHWVTSPEVQARAMQVKAALLMPHPFALITSQSDFCVGTGTLLIGPPPGPANDRKLFDLLRKNIDPSWDVLVKPRGNFQGSIEYWESKGLRSIFLDSTSSDYFMKLAQLLGRYRRIVSPTLSSLLFFAAAVRRQVEVILGYQYQAFDSPNYECYVNLASPTARAVAETFASGDQVAIRSLSEHLLGYSMLGHSGRARKNFVELVDDLRKPLHFSRRSVIPDSIRAKLALATGRSELANLSTGLIVERLRRRGNYVLTVDQFDLFLNGRTSLNFKLEPPPDGRSGRAGAAYISYSS